MNVLLMPSAYAPSIGGVEEMTRGLARQLRHLGIGVAVVTARWPSTLPQRDNIDGVEVHRLDFTLPSRRVSAMIGFLRQFRRTARALRRIADSVGTDIIHVHCLGPNTLYATHLARSIDRPLVLTTHGELQGDDTAMRRSKFMGWVHRSAFRRAAWVTACSQFTLDHVQLPDRSRSSVVYNALNRVIPAPSESAEPFVFFAGRLTHNKGVDVLLRALALVTDAPELRVAGSGADRAALEALARELGIVDRVRFLGALMPEQVDEQMGRCLFYVCPSRNEGFGLSVLEAMAAGKAVIASRTGGVPEVVQENKTALLVPPGEPMALAKAMERLLIEPSIREQLAKAGKTRARQFNWQAISGQYCELYDHVSAGCRTRQVHPRERRY